jgi:co-chaperonin GroES (HSP10)
MNLAVLGDRIFVRPDANPETTSDGLLHLVQDNKRSVTRGTVLAVGEGPEIAHRAVSRAMSALSKEFDRYIADETVSGFVRAVAAKFKGDAVRLTKNYEPEHLVVPGDRIIFSPDAGEEVRFEREVVLVMRETDVLAVVGTDNE